MNGKVLESSDDPMILVVLLIKYVWVQILATMQLISNHLILKPVFTDLKG